MKSLKSMTEQLTMAIHAKSQAPHVGPPNEMGNYPSNIWCRNRNHYGHSDQFCQAPRNPIPMVPPQGRFQNHHSLGPTHQPPQGIPCSTCNRLYPIGFGISWFEWGVTCAKFWRKQKEIAYCPHYLNMINYLLQTMYTNIKPIARCF